MANIKEMAESYNSRYPNYPPLVYTDRWLYGIWMIGNNYQSKNQFYGEYPPSYVNRVMAIFPNAKNILHLFAGSIDHFTNATSFDINADLKPDVVGDAHHLSDYFPQGEFDLIMADPPYSSEDCLHYGTPMVNRSKVVSEAVLVLQSGGYIVWLDQVLPMYRKDTVELVGTIGLIRSTNHRFRVVSIFRKVN